MLGVRAASVCESGLGSSQVSREDTDKTRAQSAQQRTADDAWGVGVEGRIGVSFSEGEAVALIWPVSNNAGGGDSNVSEG